jgi:hypothetical protein
LQQFNDAVSSIWPTSELRDDVRTMALYLKVVLPRDNVLLLNDAAELDSYYKFSQSGTHLNSLPHQLQHQLRSFGVRNAKFLMDLPSSSLTPLPLPLPSVLLSRYDGHWFSEVTAGLVTAGDTSRIVTLLEARDGLLVSLRFDFSSTSHLIRQVSIVRAMRLTGYFHFRPF